LTSGSSSVHVALPGSIVAPTKLVPAASISPTSSQACMSPAWFSTAILTLASSASLRTALSTLTISSIWRRCRHRPRGRAGCRGSSGRRTCPAAWRCGSAAAHGLRPVPTSPRCTTPRWGRCCPCRRASSIPPGRPAPGCLSDSLRRGSRRRPDRTAAAYRRPGTRRSRSTAAPSNRTPGSRNCRSPASAAPARPGSAARAGARQLAAPAAASEPRNCRRFQNRAGAFMVSSLSSRIVQGCAKMANCRQKSKMQREMGQAPHVHAPEPVPFSGLLM
jgi:hypothetical protein